MHEGPARIAKLGTVLLKRGMILSNEPGYYRRRLRHPDRKSYSGDRRKAVAGAEKPLNAFETLTLAPIHARLVDPALLTGEEIVWFDAYHDRVATRWRRSSTRRRATG